MVWSESNKVEKVGVTCQAPKYQVDYLRRYFQNPNQLVLAAIERLYNEIREEKEDAQ